MNEHKRILLFGAGKICNCANRLSQKKISIEFSWFVTVVRTVILKRRNRRSVITTMPGRPRLI